MNNIMTSMHIVSAATAAGSAFTDCLRMARSGDTVLLTQDGVYAAVAAAPRSAALLDDALARGLVIYALVADIDARGLAGKLHAAVQLVDDNGFVALTERHPRIVSWF